MISVVILAIVFLRFWRSHTIEGVALLFAAFSLALTWFRPSVFHCPTKIWMWFSGWITKILNPIVLTLIYFTVLFPFALFWRAIQRDPLNLKWSSTQETYWQKRSPSLQPKRGMKQQF